MHAARAMPNTIARVRSGIVRGETAVADGQDGSLDKLTSVAIFGDVL